MSFIEFIKKPTKIVGLFSFFLGFLLLFVASVAWKVNYKGILDLSLHNEEESKNRPANPTESSDWREYNGQYADIDTAVYLLFFGIWAGVIGGTIQALSYAFALYNFGSIWGIFQCISFVFSILSLLLPLCISDWVRDYHYDSIDLTNNRTIESVKFKEPFEKETIILTSALYLSVAGINMHFLLAIVIIVGLFFKRNIRGQSKKIYESGY